MSIYPTTQGYGTEYRDEFGRKHRRFVGSLEAAQALDRQLSESTKSARAALKNFQANTSLNTAEALDLYLASTAHSPNTKRVIRHRMLRLLKLYPGKSVAEITPPLLVELFAARRNEVAPATLEGEVNTVKAFFRWLHENWHCPSNPAGGLHFKAPESATSARALSYAEEAQILAVCHTRSMLRVLLGLDAGLRSGEKNILRKRHIDGGFLTVFAPKTHTTRRVPLTARLTDALAAATRSTTPDTLIITRAGNPTHDSDVVRKLITKKSGIRFREHDLRHTFASRLAETSTNPHIVRVLCGHARHNVTDAYVHPSDESLLAAIKRMEAANPNLQQTLWPRPPLPPPPEKEKQEMPGKRFTFRITDPNYGPLLNAKARVTDAKLPDRPGSVWCEVANTEGLFLIELKALERVNQPSTLKKEQAE